MGDTTTTHSHNNKNKNTLHVGLVLLKLVSGHHRVSHIRHHRKDLQRKRGGGDKTLNEQSKIKKTRSDGSVQEKGEKKKKKKGGGGGGPKKRGKKKKKKKKK